MKILQIIPFFVPAWGFGGPVKICSEICDELTKKGHFVCVATTDILDAHNRVKKKEELINLTKILRFSNINCWIAKNFNIFTPIGFRYFIKKNIQKFDIVHMHAFFSYQNIIASQYCYKHKIPYILHLYESPLPKPILGKTLIKTIFNYFWGYKLLVRSHKIFVVAEKEKKDLAKNYPQFKNKIQVIPNSIPEKLVKKIKIDRTKYNLKKTDKILLSLSRLAPVKGIDLLINAFEILIKKDENFKLLIVGPDEQGEKQKLQKIIDQKKLKPFIYFIDHVVGKEKEAVFSLADIYVLFSRYESFSISTLEAIQHKLPVCVSNEVGLADEIKKYNCGIIVNPYNPNICADKIFNLFKEKNIYTKNSNIFIKRYNIENIVNKILKIYNESI